MFIGLIADTHIRDRGHKASLGQLVTAALPIQIKDAFNGVDLILHAGDIYTLPVLDTLEQIAPVLASEGDDDPFEIMNDKRVKIEHVLEVEGITIWLVHDYETISLNNYHKLPDVIISGHTHKPSLIKDEGIIHINPGSPTFPKYQEKLGTVGLLEVKSGKVKIKIIQL